MLKYLIQYLKIRIKLWMFFYCILIHGNHLWMSEVELKKSFSIHSTCQNEGMQCITEISMLLSSKHTEDKTGKLLVWIWKLENNKNSTKQMLNNHFTYFCSFSKILSNQVYSGQVSFQTRKLMRVRNYSLYKIVILWIQD